MGMFFLFLVCDGVGVMCLYVLFMGEWFIVVDYMIDWFFYFDFDCLCVCFDWGEIVVVDGFVVVFDVLIGSVEFIWYYCEFFVEQCILFEIDVLYQDDYFFVVDKLYFFFIILGGWYLQNLVLVWLCNLFDNLELVLMYCLDWVIVGLFMFFMWLVIRGVYQFLFENCQVWKVYEVVFVWFQNWDLLVLLLVYWNYIEKLCVQVCVQVDIECELNVEIRVEFIFVDDWVVYMLFCLYSGKMYQLCVYFVVFGLGILNDFFYFVLYLEQLDDFDYLFQLFVCELCFIDLFSGEECVFCMWWSFQEVLVGGMFVSGV